MVKIKLGLFEGVFACTIFPNIGLIFTTLILIIAAIAQDMVILPYLWVSYLVCISLLGISLIICAITSFFSKSELVLDKGIVYIKNATYRYDQILKAEYYVWKWYAIPFLGFYQVGGSIKLKIKKEEIMKTIEFKVFYKDYLKIKEKIPNIAEINYSSK